MICVTSHCTVSNVAEAYKIVWQVVIYCNLSLTDYTVAQFAILSHDRSLRLSLHLRVKLSRVALESIPRNTASESYCPKVSSSTVWNERMKERKTNGEYFSRVILSGNYSRIEMALYFRILLCSIWKSSFDTRNCKVLVLIRASLSVFGRVRIFLSLVTMSMA